MKLIGGEERPINFGRNAHIEIEKVSGISLLDPTKSGNLQSWEAIRCITYAGLKWGLYKGDGIEPKAKYTLIKAGDLVDEYGIGDGSPIAKIISLFLESLPGKSKKVNAGESPANQ
jgi:hypothetical protein